MNWFLCVMVWNMRAWHHHHKKKKRVTSKSETERKYEWCHAVSPHRLPAESNTQRNQGKYFTAGLHFVCREVVSPSRREYLFYFALFIYSPSSLIFVESCPKLLYGAPWHIYGGQNVYRKKLVPYDKLERERKREKEMRSSGGQWMGSKIRAVSREINLQHCRETQPHFISSAAATSAGLRQPPSQPALHNIHTRRHK